MSFLFLPSLLSLFKIKLFYGCCSGFKEEKQQQARTARQKDSRPRQHSTTQQHSTTEHNTAEQGTTTNHTNPQGRRPRYQTGTPTTKHTTRRQPRATRPSSKHPDRTAQDHTAAQHHKAQHLGAGHHKETGPRCQATGQPDGGKQTTGTGKDAYKRQSTTAQHHTAAQHHRTQHRGAEHQDTPHQTTGRRANRQDRDHRNMTPGATRIHQETTEDSQAGQQSPKHNRQQHTTPASARGVRELRTQSNDVGTPTQHRTRGSTKREAARNTAQGTTSTRTTGSTAGLHSTAPRDGPSTTTRHSSGRGKTRPKHRNETNNTPQNQATHHGRAEHQTAQRSRNQHKNGTRQGHAEQQEAPRQSTTYTETAQSTKTRQGTTHQKSLQGTQQHTTAEHNKNSTTRPNTAQRTTARPKNPAQHKHLSQRRAKHKTHHRPQRHTTWKHDNAQHMAQQPARGGGSTTRPDIRKIAYAQMLDDVTLQELETLETLYARQMQEIGEMDWGSMTNDTNDTQMVVYKDISSTLYYIQYCIPLSNTTENRENNESEYLDMQQDINTHTTKQRKAPGGGGGGGRGRHHTAAINEAKHHITETNTIPTNTTQNSTTRPGATGQPHHSTQGQKQAARAAEQDRRTQHTSRAPEAAWGRKTPPPWRHRKRAK